MIYVVSFDCKLITTYVSRGAYDVIGTRVDRHLASNSLVPWECIKLFATKAEEAMDTARALAYTDPTFGGRALILPTPRGLTTTFTLGDWNA